MSGGPGLLDRPQSLFYFVPQEFHRQAFAKYIFNTISTFSLELAKQVTTKAYQNVKIINKTDLFNILPISDMWIHLKIFSFLGAWWHSGGWKLPDQAGWTGSTTNCQTEIRYVCVLFMSVKIISHSSKVGLMANNKIDTGVDKIGLAEGEVNFLKMII